MKVVVFMSNVELFDALNDCFSMELSVDDTKVEVIRGGIRLVQER